MTQPNLKKIKDHSTLVHKYVKQMGWKPTWGKAYDSFLWSITLEWMKECELDTSWSEDSDIWSVAVDIAMHVENITNG
mgnify:CR=1 FL=1